MERSLESLLVAQCAPTLAGVKPASLFRAVGSPSRLRAEAARWDEALAALGIRVLLLKVCPEACLLYVYRPEWVASILCDRSSRAFLRRTGYWDGPPAALLAQLSLRLCLGREYPHEVGLFLGYPLADVEAFIENQGWNYTCCGCWKAYGNPEVAHRCFDRYRKCTALYKQLHADGTPLLHLVIAA